MPDTAKVIQLEPEVQRHVRSRLVRLPAAAHALHERGKTLLAARFEAYFDAADDALFDLADRADSNHEQNVFFDSMREVRVQRKSIEKRFFDGFDEGFARLVAADDRDSLVPDGELSADALSLVQNDDLEQMVAMEASVNRANGHLASDVVRLSQAMRPFVPQAVNEHTNPFGPELLCRVFMAQVKRLDVDIKAKLVLFKLFDRMVVHELPSIYSVMEQVLIEHGVDIESPRGLAAKASKTERTGAPAKAVVSDKAGEESLSSGDNRVTSLVDAGPHRELMALLSFVQKLPATAFRGAEGSLEQVLSRVQAHKGQALELSATQRETVRLVGMLFDYILRERSLADPIKDVLVRLQVPVLKVALIDANFFADKSHNARRLLNEIAVQAVGWQQGNDKNPQNEPLAKCINRIVENIVHDFDLNVDVFGQALSEMSSFIEKERRRSAVLEKRMVDAEDGKARAELARKKVAAEIDSRLHKVAVPRVVADFLRGPWSNVLFVNGLKHGFDSTVWTEHLSLVSDLIWSVQPKKLAQDRQALIIRGPKLLTSLRSGLDAVSYNPFEVSELLIQIEELHIARIRGEQVETCEAESATIEPVADVKPVPEAPVPAAPAKGQVTQVNSLGKDDPYLLTVASFVQGAWFDIFEKEGDEPLRCRLAAHIKPTGKYIFVNRSGMKVAEKNRQELAVALRQGLLRPVDSGMLFERALENIVTGMRNSKPTSPLDELSNKSDRSDQ